MADDNTPYQSNDEVRPVVWSPEDASRFLTSAIHEAQRPLADALKQRPVTTKAMTLIVVILVAAAAVIAWILSSQLTKTERMAERALTARDDEMSQRMGLQAQMISLEGRLQTAESQQEKLLAESNELKKTKGDIQRYRRQNELLKSQIAGLEMEKMALARQLEAVRAMALEDLDDAEAAEPVPAEEPEEPEENTETTAPLAEASTEASANVEPEREAPPAAAPEKAEMEAPATESPTANAPAAAAAPAGTPPPAAENASAAAAPAIGVTGFRGGTEAATIEPAEQIELVADPAVAEDAAVSITGNPAPAAGGIASDSTDRSSPPILYESFEQSAKEYGERLAERIRPDDQAENATPPERPEETDKAALPEDTDKYSAAAAAASESAIPEEPADTATPEESAPAATEEPPATEEENDPEADHGDSGPTSGERPREVI